MQLYLRISVRHLLAGWMVYFSFDPLLCAATTDERDEVTQFRKGSVHFSFVDWSQIKIEWVRWGNRQGKSERERASEWPKVHNMLKHVYVHLFFTDINRYRNCTPNTCIHAHHNFGMCEKNKSETRSPEYYTKPNKGSMHFCISKMCALTAGISIAIFRMCNFSNVSLTVVLFRLLFYWHSIDKNDLPWQKKV